MVASNTYITPSIVAKEVLMTLLNNTVMLPLVDRRFESEFKKVGSTVTIKKRPVYSSTAVSNTVSVNPITESSVNVVLDTLIDITLEITSKELTLDLRDFRETVIQPAMEAHADHVDAALCALYSDIAGHYPVSSTPVLKDIAELEAVMSVNKCPTAGRNMVLDPMTRAGYMAVDAFVHADKKGDGGKALREAELGKILGFQTYMDQNIKSHTSGAMDDLAGLLKGALAASKGSATIDAITDSGTVLAGDLLKFTGVDEWFVVHTNATASAATIVVEFYPNTASSIADNTVATFQGSGKANLAFHKQCFAYVTAPLEPPIGGAVGTTESLNGLSCRVVYDYRSMEKVNMVSVDLLYGVKTLDRSLGARLEDTR